MTSLSPDRYAAFLPALPMAGPPGVRSGHAGHDGRRPVPPHLQRLARHARRGHPQLVAFDALEATYTATNAAVIAVAPEGGSVFTREALVAIEELTEAAWEVPWSSGSTPLSTTTTARRSRDDLNVERLVDDAASLSDEDLARIKKIALGEPSVAGRLVSRDGRVAGLVISFTLPEHSDAAEIQTYHYLRGLLDKARAAHPDIAYHVTGNVFVNQVLTEAAQDDMGILAPAAFLVIVAVGAFLLRSLFGTLGIVILLIFVVASTMGVIGWTGLVLNAANSGIPLIIMTLAICDSVHIIGTVNSGMGQGLDRGRGHRRIAARQCLAGVPHDGHHDDRLPQHERLGLAALSDPRQPGSRRHADRLRVFHDAAAGVAGGAAAARARRTRRGFGFLRSPGRLRGGAPQAVALVRGRLRGRPGGRRAACRADRQLDHSPGQALRVPARHGLRHREPDRCGNPGVQPGRRA